MSSFCVFFNSELVLQNIDNRGVGLLYCRQNPHPKEDAARIIILKRLDA
jgi:hypothetical protein